MICSTPIRHRIESGVWSDQTLAYYDDQGYTIRDAINYWYLNVSDTEESVVFRDVCSGPHCSNVCPEVITLHTDDTGEVWSTSTRLVITCAVLLIAVICLLMKVRYNIFPSDVSSYVCIQLYCCVWIRLLTKKQQRFLQLTAVRQDEESPVKRMKREVRIILMC